MTSAACRCGSWLLQRTARRVTTGEELSQAALLPCCLSSHLVVQASHWLLWPLAVPRGLHMLLLAVWCLPACSSTQQGQLHLRLAAPPACLSDCTGVPWLQLLTWCPDQACDRYNATCLLTSWKLLVLAAVCITCNASSETPACCAVSCCWGCSPLGAIHS
jgi:hypothetical protein